MSVSKSATGGPPPLERALGGWWIGADHGRPRPVAVRVGDQGDDLERRVGERLVGGADVALARGLADDRAGLGVEERDRVVVARADADEGGLDHLADAGVGLELLEARADEAGGVPVGAGEELAEPGAGRDLEAGDAERLLDLPGEDLGGGVGHALDAHVEEADEIVLGARGGGGRDHHAEGHEEGPEQHGHAVTPRRPRR